MHETNCYLCGVNKPQILFAQQGNDPYLNLVSKALHKIERNFVVCTQCGFAYRNPILDSDELSTLYERYDQDVFAGSDSDTYFDKIITLPHDTSENWQKIDWLAKVLKKLDKKVENLAVLDIGCGGGTFLHTISERIKIDTICGVELNSAYAELAARRLNANILNEAYTSGMFNNVFDLLTCTKVLEHVSDPLPFLKDMASDLPQEGLIFLEVPDVSNLFNLPPDDSYFFIPHVYFFSTNTLSELISRVGFSVLESRVINTSRNRAYLQVIATKQHILSSSPPFDDPTRLERRVVANLEQYQ